MRSQEIQDNAGVQLADKGLIHSPAKPGQRPLLVYLRGKQLKYTTVNFGCQLTRRLSQEQGSKTSAPASAPRLLDKMLAR